MDRRLNTFYLSDRIADVSTAGQIYVAVPAKAILQNVYTTLNGAIATADDTITVKTAAGTVGTITVTQSGSAAGDIDSLAASSNTSVPEGSYVEIETSGASTNAVSLGVVLELRYDDV